MTEKEKIHEVLNIIHEYCIDGGSCSYCAFRDNRGDCRFITFAELNTDSMSELENLHDWLESIDKNKFVE